MPQAKNQPTGIEWIKQRCAVDRETGCWIWRGRPSSTYGKVSIDCESLGAHRVAYALANGGVPDGLHVLHSCDNPPCCNPEHLFAGTIDDNNKDRKAKGGYAKGEKCHLSKLTQAQVDAVRKRRLAGETLRAIGDDFGVTIQAINLICKGKNWKPVKEPAPV